MFFPSSFSLAVSPYDPDSRFNMNSLSRLEEGVGIKIVTSLAEIPTQLAAVLGMKGREQEVEIVIGKWESGQSQHPITWRSLLDILKELDLEDLSQEIEDYMHGEQGMCVPVYFYMWYIFVMRCVDILKCAVDTQLTTHCSQQTHKAHRCTHICTYHGLWMLELPL